MALKIESLPPGIFTISNLAPSQTCLDPPGVGGLPGMVGMAVMVGIMGGTP